LLDAFELRAVGLVGNAFELDGAFIAGQPPAEHKCRSRRRAEISRLARRVQRIEYDLKRVGHGNAHQRGLGCTVARTRGFDGKALRAHELEQLGEHDARVSSGVGVRLTFWR